MNKPTEHDGSLLQETEPARKESAVGSSRRRFTRNALAGGAVMLSLGNRAAWGQMVDDCLSEPTWNSWVNGGDMFVSFDVNNPAQVEKDMKAKNIRAKGVWEREIQGVKYICPRPGPPTGETSTRQEAMSDMLK